MKKTLLFVVATLVFTLFSFAQEYEIDSTTKTFRDAARRNRNVRARIYYPEVSANNTQRFPVLVLGHGFIMGSDAYQNFYDTLVPKGYIIAFVDTEGSIFANHSAYAEDLAFMTTAIQHENMNPRSPLFGLVASKTALIGHSMGGGAATVAASQTDVQTLVLMAPALLRFDTLAPATQVTEPTVVFSGGADGVTPADENHLPIFENLNSDCKYFINIEGGAHCYYANSNWACDFGERSASRNISISRNRQQQIVFQLLDAWLDYQLNDTALALENYHTILEELSGISSENNCTGRRQTLTTSPVDLSVYPNPSSSLIKVAGSNKEAIKKIALYELSGSLLVETTKDYMDVSQMKPGSYIVKIYSNRTITTKTIMIK